MPFYHGSHKQFDIGIVLTPQSDHEGNWGINQWYQVLQKFRPPSMLSRNEAVYMSSDIEDIDLSGGFIDYVYQVKPLGKVEKHDINWISELEVLLENPEENEKEIIQAAHSYWQGIPHHDENVWEFLTPKAVIVKLVETNV